MTVESAIGTDGVTVVDRAATKVVYQPALDGVRGVAVLLVLVFHHGLTAGTPSLRGGFLGVDAFFVLSGYLITSLLLAEHASTGRVAIGAFWARRARRLLPALLILLFGVALYTATLTSPTGLAQLRGEAFATLLYVQNWHLAAEHFQPSTLLDHTWSLSVEEQWYFVWPLFLAILLSWKRARPARLFSIIIAMAAASAIWTYALDRRGSNLHAYYGTDARAQELLVGAALAVLLQHRFARAGPNQRRIGLEAIGLIGALVVAAIVVVPASGSDFLAHGGYLCFSVAVASVIAAAVQPRGMIVRPVLSALPLRKLGLISYGLYLYHWPIYFFLTAGRTQVSGTALLIVRIIASIAAAVASLVLVEQPIRRGALRGVKLRVVAPVAIVVVVVATVLATRETSPGLVSPSTTAVLRQAATAPGRRVLLVGDGPAIQLASVGGSYTRDGWNGVAVAFPDCSLISGAAVVPGSPPAAEAPHCTQLLPALRTVRDQFEPGAVVITPGNSELYDRLVGSVRLQVGTFTWAVHANGELDGVVKALAESGRMPVLITNIPCTGSPSSGTLFDAAAHNTRRRAAVNVFLARYALNHRPAVRFGDLDNLLCRDGAPIRSVAGRQIIDSRGVLTPDGARYVWDWVTRQLAAPASP